MLAEFIIYHFNLQEHGYTWVVLVVLLLVFFGAYWLLNKSPVSEWFKSSEDVVPPFLALPAIMFALFISALATDIWQKHYDAKQALIREASALRSVILLAPNLGERGQYLSQATENYINAVIDREWQAMMLKDHPNKESALPELEALDFNIAKIGSDPSLPQYVAIRLDNALELLRQSRQQRLSLAHDGIAASKWASPIMLAVITLVTIGVVHIRRPRAMMISMILTILCILATMQLLSQNRSPYIGTAAVTQEALYDAKKLLYSIRTQP